jgi:hypothetical protein
LAVLLALLIQMQALADNQYHIQSKYTKDGKEILQGDYTLNLMSTQEGVGGTKYDFIIVDGTVISDVSGKKTSEEINIGTLLSFQYNDQDGRFSIIENNIRLGGEYFKNLFTYVSSYNLSFLQPGRTWEEASTIKFPNNQEIMLHANVTVKSEEMVAGQRCYRLTTTTNESFHYNGDRKVWPSNVEYNSAEEIVISPTGTLYYLHQKQNISTAGSGQGITTVLPSVAAQEKHTYSNEFELTLQEGVQESVTEERIPKPKLTQESSKIAEAPVEEYATLEEFSCQGDDEYWFTIFALSNLHKAVISSNEVRYTINPLGFSMSTANFAPTSTAFEKGIKPITLSRNPETELLSLPTGKSIYLEKVNSVIKELFLNPETRRSQWKENIHISNEFTQLAGAELEISVDFEVEPVLAAGYKLLLIRYSSEPFVYQTKREDYSIEQQFRGLTIISDDKEKTYYSIYRYSGSVSPGVEGTGTFEGQQTIYMVDIESGKAIVTPDAIPGFEDMLSSYPLITNLKKSSEYSNTVTLPNWFSSVWGVSRENLIYASVIGEQRTNLLPIVAVILGAHIVDDLYTLGANIVHDLADIVSEKEGAKFDPFDEDIESPLKKYFYEPAARGYVETAADFGLIDQADVEAYTKIGGSLLKLPGDIVTIAVNPRQLWGSSAHLSGLSKSATIMLGKFSYASQKIMGGEEISNIIDFYGLFRDGFSLGEEIATVVSTPKPKAPAPVAPKPTVPKPYVPPAYSSILPYVIGGGAIVAAGAGAVYYITSKDDDGVDDDFGDDFDTYNGGLSDVTVNTRNITITVYDYDKIDGDQIDLIVNGKYILNNFVIGPPPGKTVNVTLNKGSNSVIIHADNVGSIWPNTAAIVISNVVSGLPEQSWMLGLEEDASFTIAYNPKAAPRLQPAPINYNLNVPLNETTRAHLGYYDNQIGNRHLGLNISKNISNNRFYMG